MMMFRVQVSLAAPIDMLQECIGWHVSGYTAEGEGSSPSRSNRVAPPIIGAVGNASADLVRVKRYMILIGFDSRYGYGCRHPGYHNPDALRV